MTDAFPLTREAALRRWREFLPRVSAYGARRNAVRPPHDDVSRLSPAIRFGLIRPEEIVRDTLARHPLSRVEKWVQELCWRSYWKGWLEMRPQVWRSWRQRLRELHASLPEEQLARARQVSEGRSGVAVMDRFALELRQTGYLHNHARMWWASFWIHAERLPWELGAEFFFQHLLDADPASNLLSWRWVAGLQTAGKTYLVRRSNLERWCDPSLVSDTTGLERLEDGCVTPFVPRDHVDLTRHPPPVLDTFCPPLKGRAGLWVHADDLCLEDSPLASCQPVAAVAFTSLSTYRRLGLSEARIQSIHTALTDGLTRAGTHLGCATLLRDADSTAQGLAEWVKAERLDAIVALAPHVGPVADALPRIQQALQVMNVPLHLLRRPWDGTLFPWARSGFFPFWEKAGRWLASQDAQPSLNLR
jgi:deoxyribodipyrimidine photo-lyase